MKVGDEIIETDKPEDEIRKVLARYRSPGITSLPPFTGGLVGYFAYDYIKYAEKSLHLTEEDEEQFNDLELAGASPETLVKLQDGVLHTFPLAGTRRRGIDEAEDKKLVEELLADPKELAEHNMLVDLGRNDLGRISKFGTVSPEKLREVQFFSHVMHIGSTVRGEIRDDEDALSAIGAVLPGESW